MLGHRRWLLKPMVSPPKRKDFGLPDKPIISKSQLMVVRSQLRKKIDSWRPDFAPFSEVQKIYLHDVVEEAMAEMSITNDGQWECAARTLGYDENFIALLHKENEFAERESDWEKYNLWKKNRNPARAAMEAKFGFDGKHASHLIRLARMAKEIITTGKVIVKRPDAEELISIRQGAWSYEKLIEHVDLLKKEIDEVYLTSSLKQHADKDKLNELCQELIELSFDV